MVLKVWLAICFATVAIYYAMHSYDEMRKAFTDFHQEGPSEHK